MRIPTLLRTCRSVGGPVAGLAVLALLRVSTPVPAGGEVRVLVTETDPALPATLGHWHRFNVRFGYESDRPIRVQGQAYWQGRNVTSITGGSPVYPTGTGDGKRTLLVP